MSLTPASTASGSASSVDLTRPTSITVVTSTGNPSSDASWTTTVPKVLYTAPSDCRHVKIYWRKSNQASGSYSYGASYFPNSSSVGYYYGLNITNTDGTITREIYRGTTHSYGFFYLNSFMDVDINNTPILQENDTFLTTNANSGSFFMSGNVFTLAPGEKLQIFTGHNSMNQDYNANFEAWVYN